MMIRHISEYDKTRKSTRNGFRGRLPHAGPRSACGRLKDRKPKQETLGKCVYFVRAGEAVKVGYTSNLSARLEQLQTGNPQVVTCEASIWVEDSATARKIERALHSRIIGIGFKLHGEWGYMPNSQVKALCRWAKVAFGEEIRKVRCAEADNENEADFAAFLGREINQNRKVRKLCR